MGKSLMIMKRSLKNSLNRITSIINESENEVLVLDYTYCVMSKKNLVDIRSYYFNGYKGYSQKLAEFIEQDGNSIRLSGNKSIECIYESLSAPFIKAAPLVFETYSSGVTDNLKIASIAKWHKFCRKEKLGGFLMTTFYRVSPNHLIGIYLVLTKPIPETLKGHNIVLKLSDVIKDYLMTEGWSITYELVNDNVLKSLLQQDIGFNKAVEIEVEDLRKYKNEVDNNGHTIFNLLPDALLGINMIKNQLKRPTGSYVDISKSLENEEKKLKLTNIMFRIIANREIDEFKNKSVCDLLRLLYKLEKRGRVNLKFKNIKAVDYIPLNDGDNNHLANKIFIVLWNLWHNMIKYSKDKIPTVCAFQHNDKLAISFFNEGRTLYTENCHFLLGLSSSPIAHNIENSGLSIVKNKTRELGWEVLEATTKKINSNCWENKIILLTK